MSEPSARKEFPLKQIGAAIANLYARLQPKRSGAAITRLTPSYEQDEAKTQKVTLRDTILALDDLPITNTITRRWPLAKLNYPAFVRSEETASLPPLLQSPLLPLPQPGSQALQPVSDSYEGSSLAEDETEEMDALPGDNGEG